MVSLLALLAELFDSLVAPGDDGIGHGVVDIRGQSARRELGR
jgi:hypothetical protein